jgi:DNA-binding MarR family transcriptional regulator
MSTEEPTPTDYEAASTITSSIYRQAAMSVLSEGAATPTQIAAATDHDISHISRALTDLTDRDLVELVVPEDTKKGRLYALTEAGEAAVDAMGDLAVTTLGTGSFGSPGLYLLNASGEAVPLATEGGDGDRQLLREVLAEYDVTAADKEVQES